MTHRLDPSVSDLPFGLFSFVPANNDDTEALVPLLLDSGDGLYEYLVDGLSDSPVETWLARFIESERSPYSSTNWRLCLLDEEPVGAICLCPALLLNIGAPRLDLSEDRQKLIESFSGIDDASYHVVSLAVSELYQQQHIGSTLLSWATAEGRAQGYESLSLFCRIDNDRALTFYRHHGFDIVRTTTPPDDCLIGPSHLLVRQI